MVRLCCDLIVEVPRSTVWYRMAEMHGRHEAAWGQGFDDGGVADNGLGVWFWCCHCSVCIFRLWIVSTKGLGLVCCCYCFMFVFLIS